MFCQQRQRVVVGVTPARIFEHALQMRYRRENATQFMLHFFQRQHQRIEAVRHLCSGQLGKLLPMCCDKLAERRNRMCRFEIAKTRQPRGIEHWIWHYLSVRLRH